MSIWSISNPALTAAFDACPGSRVALDSWVDVSTLSPANAVQDVCRRGFVAADASAGIEFIVGTTTLPPAAASGATQQFLLCSLGVGRSYVLDGGAPGAPRTLPAGYDSLYVHAGGDASAAAAYAHRYVLLGAKSDAGGRVVSAALPKYVVHFSFDPTPAPRRKAGDINLEEIKARISEALSALGPAAAAATEKMLGDIGEAYSEALAASRAPDARLEERRARIQESLKSIDGALTAVQANQQAVEEKL